MLRFVIPLVFLAVGVGGGFSVASFLSSEKDGVECKPETQDCKIEPKKTEEKESDSAFVRMNNQFIVPVIRDDRVAAMVVLSLSLEVPPGETETVFQLEPLLRDTFLQILFDHAYTGGFDGAFTHARNMRVLREALHAGARKLLGPSVRNVLIVDIVRQEV